MKSRIDPYEDDSRLAGRAPVYITNRPLVLEADPNYHAQAVVVSNDCVAYGNALAHLYKSRRKRDRIRECLSWLVWDMYHLMNDWPSILERSTAQLKIRVRPSFTC